MRLHTCLLTSLPPLYRMQLLHQGKTHQTPYKHWSDLWHRNILSNRKITFCQILWLRNSDCECTKLYTSCVSLSVCLCGRPVNVPLCVGLPLGGWGGDAEHDPSHAERGPPVVWAQGRRSGLVDTQHQHTAQDGGEGTATSLEQAHIRLIKDVFSVCGMLWKLQPASPSAAHMSSLHLNCWSVGRFLNCGCGCGFLIFCLFRLD